MSFTTLRSIYDIPTIAFNYKAGRLTSHPQPRCAPSPALNQRISLIVRDITTLSFDAIVNAANSQLSVGSGVDGAIHRAAGPNLAEECRKSHTGGCPVGDAVITAAYNLPSKHVIHTVGPRCEKGAVLDTKALASCYTKCLALAEESGSKSIGFCSISTAIYGFPKREAAMIACSTVRRYLEEHTSSPLERVVFVVYSEADYTIYKETIP